MSARHVKALADGSAQHHTVTDLRREHPGVSFPTQPSAELLAAYGLQPLVEVSPPAFDPATQRMAEGEPALVGGQWTQTWAVLALSADELAERAAAVREQRQQAYQQEADPLFFKSQRGDATHQEWLDKVAEIKARFPVIQQSAE